MLRRLNERLKKIVVSDPADNVLIRHGWRAHKVRGPYTTYVHDRYPQHFIGTEKGDDTVIHTYPHYPGGDRNTEIGKSDLEHYLHKTFGVPK